MYNHSVMHTVLHIGEIGNIDIDVDPVIEINREAMLFVHLFDTNNSLYTSSANITLISSENETDVSYFESAPRKILYHLLYQYAGNYTIEVIVKNEVSMMNKSVTIEVVCK